MFVCVYMLYGYVKSLDQSTLRAVGTVNDKTLAGIYNCTVKYNIIQIPFKC